MSRDDTPRVVLAGWVAANRPDTEDAPHLHDVLKDAIQRHLREGVPVAPELVEPIYWTWLELFEAARPRPGPKPGKPRAAAEFVEQMLPDDHSDEQLMQARRIATEVFRLDYDRVADAHGRLVRQKRKTPG